MWQQQVWRGRHGRAFSCAMSNGASCRAYALMLPDAVAGMACCPISFFFLNVVCLGIHY